MNLRALRRHRDAYGRQDPFWAILSQPDKVQGRWDPQEFFRTGRDEIATVLSYLSSLGLTVGTSRALDFGCGVGASARPWPATSTRSWGSISRRP